LQTFHSGKHLLLADQKIVMPNLRERFVRERKFFFKEFSKDITGEEKKISDI